jgi:hypothetical protein
MHQRIDDDIQAAPPLQANIRLEADMQYCGLYCLIRLHNPLDEYADENGKEGYCPGR